MLFNNINNLGKSRTPFFFIIDFDGKDGIVLPLNELSNNNISLLFNGIQYGGTLNLLRWINQAVLLKPISKEQYQHSFNIVKEGINNGDSYLLNLTFPTKVSTQYTLEDIYYSAQSKYKVYVKDKFVFFSPEPFIMMSNNFFSLYQSKGTCDVNLPK